MVQFSPWRLLRHGSRVLRAALVIASALGAVTWTGAATARAADAPGNPERGAYILRLGGCVACHTNTKKKGPMLAGGVALKSPYGTFYAPNITPDKQTGIGGWSTEDFIRAMTHGVLPDGAPLYPAFPYTSFTHMTRQDLIDLKAYLDTVPPVHFEAPENDLRFPYNLRIALVVWRWLFFEPKPFKPEANKSAEWNRGAYLVTGPGHCGECHSPRNFFGAVDQDRALAGTSAGPDGKPVPSIRPRPKHGIGGWTKEDVAYALKTGGKPDGDVLGGAMGDVIEDSTSHWTDADLNAVATYLLSLPAR